MEHKIETKISASQVAKAEAQIVEKSKRIDFYLTEYSIEALAMKTHNNEYVVPDYQREFTWEDPRKSRFIESVIMGLPIPFIFFWEMPDGRLEIVDGSQRLRTLDQFIYEGFKLGPLTQLSELSGFRFSDLTAARQRKIKNRSIRGIVLNEHADAEARLDMFERINTGSKRANTAEIRRGSLAGPFTQMVIELSNLELFTSLAPLPEKARKERGHEELVSRFFAYGDGLSEYRDRPSDFIDKYTEKMNAEFLANPSLEEAYRNRFIEMLNFVSQNFPIGFRKTINATRTPRSRFEAIAIGVYKALTEKTSLSSDPNVGNSVRDWIESEEFLKITGADGANARSKLNRRIDFVKEKLTDYDQ